MKYEPTLESVEKHEIPDWYNDAKFGIFFHWGLYSVPAYAKKGNNLNEMTEQDNTFESSMTESPYSEWYLNKLRIEGSSTQRYHYKVYGKDSDYYDFQKDFEKANKNLNMNDWADVCKKAGAKYVVLVTKHHDGYCMWPSEVKNPSMPDYQSNRNFVEELTDAVRSRDMKMGYYYSGIFDWTFFKKPILDVRTFIGQHLASNEYCEYSVAQMKELIEKCHPSILWNDIGFPPQYNLNKMFADYYNTVPEGVINDRWKQFHLNTEKDAEAQLDKWVEEAGERMKTLGLEGMMMNDDHHDFSTPEYTTKFEYREKKWELTRGIGMSFAYNKEEDENDMLSATELITTLVDVVSKNGNFLLNIGPMADGTIPEMQKKPLFQLGAWLEKNGEAIYGTRCWREQEGITADGLGVRYTEKPDALYVFILSSEISTELTIKNLEIPKDSRILLLGDGSSLEWEQSGSKYIQS
ncbi:alpha-L-fucosidase [Clostridium sp. C105KSO13]|uniref:alpha-L-fucosidase n=1 Tax=Clostridium sp. C105KSO13 TaxID=1776045 RepID=UPI00074081E0|nr:alpha-L-fucosidase [Clostridium sp. C105KSO13]CUX38522.1 Alpha-L-fucosidase [Clostridium sp. C105KSO13]